MFISCADVVSKTGGRKGKRGRYTKNYDMAFSSSVAGKDKGLTRRQIVFYISGHILKQARIMIGDQIDVLFDPLDKTGLIKRVTQGGYTLSSTKKYKDPAIPSRGRISITHVPSLPFINELVTCSAVSVTDEGILFQFPKETIFPDNKILMVA
jgi:hypothetical protein